MPGLRACAAGVPGRAGLHGARPGRAPPSGYMSSAAVRGGAAPSPPNRLKISSRSQR